VETVGAGQSEVDIRNIAYTTLVLSVPGLGDHIQAQKAGLIEIADIQVVNKKDLPGAEAVGVELDMMLDDVFNSADKSCWRPPVLLTNSVKDDGIDLLLEQIWKHRDYLESNGYLIEKKKDKIRRKINNIIFTEIENFIQNEILSVSDIDKYTDMIKQQKTGLYETAYEILNGYLDKLRCLDPDD
jgi:LAO/AO transport system kinase